MPHLFHATPQQNRYYAWFSALHTRIDLLFLGSLSESDFQAGEEAVRAELLAVEKMGNRFDPDSELSRAVAAANALSSSLSSAPCDASLAKNPQPSALSPSLYSLLARCLCANRETDGLFDITVNTPDYHPGLINAVQLSPFPDSPGGTLSFHHASLPSITGGVPKGRGGSSLILDLSGILKGYALERLRVLLPTLGIKDALINLGNSSILSLGHNPSDIPSGHCLTTSGNATPDRRHIRNPLTGEFITGQRQVSVTTADAIEGEILATVAGFGGF